MLVALVAIGLLLDAGWIHAKAALAQHLLHSAWARSETGETHKPWPWADTHPVARLRIATQDIDQIVLAGDAGRSLAFGPGWAEASADPGAQGTVVISGHRDTHFAFLRDLQAGELVVLESSRGSQAYRIVATRVADIRHERIALDQDADALLLVTCYPFDAAAAGGPLRYVVRAEALRGGEEARLAHPILVASAAGPRVSRQWITWRSTPVQR